MIKITLKTSSGLQKATGPSGWDEVTTGTYQKIMTDWDADKTNIYERDHLKLFNILFDTNITSKINSKLSAQIWKCIRFVYDEVYSFTGFPLPIKFRIDGAEVTIPKNIEELTVGQNLMARQKLDDAGYWGSMAYMIAVYLQPLIDDSELKSKRVDELELQLLDMPIAQTYPIGFFLLSERLQYGSQSTSVLPRTKRFSLNQIVISLRSWLR